MALYENKYKISFYDHWGDHWEAYILAYGFSGDVTALTGGKPAIRWEMNGETDKFARIKGQTVTLQIIASTRTQFDEFISSNYIKYKLELYKNASIFWYGWSVPDQFARPDTYIKYALSLEFNDRLGILREIDFKTTDGEYHTGKKTLAELIFLCINKTEIRLDMWEAVNVYEENMDSGLGDSMLIQTYENSEKYKDWNCYDILNNILTMLGARLWQGDGYWNLVRIKELGKEYNRRLLDNNTDTVNSYGTNNEYITLTGATAAAVLKNVWMFHSAEKTIDPPLKEIKITQEHDFNQDLFSLDLTNEELQGFTNVGSMSYSIGKTTTFNPNLSKKYLQLNADVVTGAKYLEYDLCTLSKLSDEIYESIYFETNLIYTTFQDDLPDTATRPLIKFLWISGGTTYIIEGDEDDFIGAVIDTAFPEEDSLLKYTIPLEFKESSEKFKIIQKGFKAALSTNDIDTDIEIKIRIYPPMGDGAYIRIFENDFKVKLLKSEFDIPDKTDYSYTNNKNYIRNLDFSIKSGDIPSDFFASFVSFYNSILYYKSGANYVPTQIWNNRGETNELKILEILRNTYAQLYSVPYWIISGTLLGHITPGLYIVDTDGAKYLVDYISGDVKKSQFDLALIEIEKSNIYLQYEDGEYFQLETGEFAEIE